VAKRVVGAAVQEQFGSAFPATPAPKRQVATRSPSGKGSKDTAIDETPYKEVLDWFSGGNAIELTDELPAEAYAKALDRVAGLRAVATRHLKPADEAETALAMEFV